MEIIHKDKTKKLIDMSLSYNLTKDNDIRNGKFEKR